MSVRKREILTLRNKMANLQIAFQPGMVTAVFFIVFDLIMLSIFDVVLERIVCTSYYYHIRRGKPIAVQSVNIPGVTTCLVGRFWDRTNVVALLVKVAFLAVVFSVDINTQTTFKSYALTSTFDFEPSDASFPDNKVKTVERVKSRASVCRTITPEGVIFYRQAFNLSGNVVLDTEFTNETSDLILIDKSTLVCLSPDLVTEPVPLLEVSGCSPQRTGNCSDLDAHTIAATNDLFPLDGGKSFSVEYNDLSGEHYFFFYQPSIDVGQTVWKDYSIKSLTCVIIDAGVEFNVTARRLCLVVSRIENTNGTLIELWRVQRNGTDDVGTRQFPGPILNGDYDIGIKLSLVILANTISQISLDWRSFASLFLTEALLYSPYPRTVTETSSRTVVTEVPWIPLGLAIFAFVLVFIALAVVCTATGRDKRPKINTIDGLSSILREEFNPTGQSYETGRTSVIGLFDSPTETRSIKNGEEAVYVAAVRK